MTVLRRFSRALALIALSGGLLGMPAVAAAADGTARAGGFGALLGSTAAGAEASSDASPRASGVANALGAPGGLIGRVEVRALTVADGPAASAEATSTARDVLLLGGRVVAADLRLVVRAFAGPDGQSAGIADYAISGLLVDGQPVAISPGTRVDLAGVGTLTILEQVVDGASSVRANGLRIEVTDPASGLPPGTEIVVGHVEASAVAGEEPHPSTAPTAATAPAAPVEPSPSPEPTAPDTSTAPVAPPPPPPPPSAPPPSPDPALDPPSAGTSPAEPGAPEPTAPRVPPSPPPAPVDPPSAPPAGLPSLQPVPAPLGLPRRAAPPAILPTASAGYVFPVYGGLAAYVDDYGAPRAVTGWHQGNDIFAATGTPVLAVADGTLRKVGVNALGGNRLWLADDRGNTFYYAHLSAYAPIALNGARVRAGEVIGFVGNTGQAITTPPHLHFEIHPADGDSVNPYPYLLAWERRSDVPLAFRAAEVADGQAPAVGVVLVDVAPAVEVVDDPGDGIAEAVP